MVILQHNLGSIFSYGNQKSGPVISRSTRMRIRTANRDSQSSGTNFYTIGPLFGSGILALAIL